MKFSIIIGTYNQEKTLPKTLEGLEKQTFRDFEVHVCSDGSNYNEMALVRKFTVSTGIPCYFHWQPQKGMRLAKNLNQGVRNARGEYCVFLMGDSYPAMIWLSNLNELAADNVLISSFRINVNEKQEIITSDWRYGDKAYHELDEIEHADPEAPWKNMTGNGMVIPTKWLQSIGGWPEQYEGYGKDDWYLCLQAKKHKMKCFTATRAVIYHYDHPGQPDNEKSTELFLKEVNDSLT